MEAQAFSFYACKYLHKIIEIYSGHGKSNSVPCVFTREIALYRSAGAYSTQAVNNIMGFLWRYEWYEND